MSEPTGIDVVRLAAAFQPQSGWHEAEAHRRWGLSGPRFYQRLAAALQDPAVEAALPVEVHRLRRVRAARMARRAA